MLGAVLFYWAVGGKTSTIHHMLNPHNKLALDSVATLKENEKLSEYERSKELTRQIAALQQHTKSAELSEEITIPKRLHGVVQRAAPIHALDLHRPFLYRLCTDTNAQLSQSCSRAISATEKVQKAWRTEEYNTGDRIEAVRAVHALRCSRLKRAISSMATCGASSIRLQRLGQVIRKLDSGSNVSVLVVGGSMTSGAGVDGIAQAWPQFLQHLMKVVWPSAQIRVHNEGHGSWSADTWLHSPASWARLFASASYDLIVTDFAVNDQVFDEADVNKTAFSLYAEYLALPFHPAILALETFCTAGKWKKEAHCGAGGGSADQYSISTAANITWAGQKNASLFWCNKW